MILFQLLDIVNFIYLECNTIEYDFKISATKFPGKIYAKYLRNNSKIKSKYSNGYDIKLEDLRESLVSFSIYYYDFKYTFISQSPKMQLVDFGMSFLSFGELIQIIIEVLIILFEKNKVRN